ncbi:MAG TPA: HlyD family efflux transporter periplasmic adaptor subunit [Oligoflexia bacterium]|nr:HlyD family efflux transporter periplasmic adaptor subunit [Oligoflexia bacterium]HMP48929.1 HlyD family efflux transporter periplasmic adaptor subunit [Oligoflexia bacterium]
MTNINGKDYRTLREIEKEVGVPLKTPSLVRSKRSISLAASIVLSAIIAGIMSLVIIPWVQTVQGSGRVIAYSPNERQQQIDAPVDGQIVHWHVMEGAHVKKGELIVDIADIDPNFLERVSQERDAALAKLTANQKSWEASRKNLDRQLNLFEQGLSSRRAYEMAEIETAKFASEVASASAELVRIESRLSRQSAQKVLAPRDGIVQRILAPQGGVYVRQGSRLATIVPESEDLAVELLIKGNDLPIISIGRHVRLQFEGWPAIQFSGWPSVAIGTFGGTVSLIDPSDDGSGNFRILVTPDDPNGWPEAPYLRQGVRAVGWVMLDTVRLGWELWRRFNAFPVSTENQPVIAPSEIRGPGESRTLGESRFGS